MNISEEVRLILDDHLISHGRLKLNAFSRSKHHAVTDSERVYVKVLKSGTLDKASLLKTELDFAFSTNYGTNPVMEQITHRSSKDHLIVMSAWEYEQQIPIAYNLNPMQIAQAANELYKIHSFPKYKALRRNSDDEFQNYASCLTSHSFKFLGSEHQSRIKNLYKGVIQPATDSLTVNPEMNVVSHGQAILDKIVTKPSGVQWVDYEYVRAAPREYDASRMYLELHHRMNRPDLWTVFKSQYESSLGRPFNDSLLDQFASLHLGKNALNLASTTLHTMNQDRLLGYLQEVTKVLLGQKNLAGMDYSRLNWNN